MHAKVLLRHQNAVAQARKIGEHTGMKSDDDPHFPLILSSRADHGPQVVLDRPDRDMINIYKHINMLAVVYFAIFAEKGQT
jgi:hypothetical protein